MGALRSDSARLYDRKNWRLALKISYIQRRIALEFQFRFLTMRDRKFILITRNQLYNPGIAHVALRNGVKLAQTVTIAGHPTTIEYALIDTYFPSNDLFVRHYNEISIALGTNKRASSVRSYLRGEVSYQFSSESKGFNFSLGYRF